MKDVSQVREWLKILGLSPYEINGYLALLNHENLTAGELARFAVVPRQKIYDAMDNLHRMGLCIVKHGRVRRYEAAPPSEGFATLAEDIKAASGERIATTRRLSDILTKHYEKNRKPVDLLAPVEVFKNRTQARNVYNKLVRLAKREVLSFVKPPYLIHPADYEAKAKALGRGVAISTLYQREGSTSLNRKLEFEVDKRRKIGEKNKIVHWLPMKVLIVDESHVMIALEELGSRLPSHTNLAIQHRGLAAMLKIGFYRYWNS